MFDEIDLKTFGEKIHQLIQGKNLSRKETKDMFCQVLNNTQPQLQQGALLAALTSKGETVEEIAGTWEAIHQLDTAKVQLDISSPLVENCGTGMDGIKTFNISTAAAIIASANGIHIARHGARAITSKCGTVDILQELGINVECTPETVKKSIEKCGIGIFNGMSPQIHPNGGLARILSQIRFGTILNIAASLANPASPTYAVRGVYSKDKVELVAKVMKEIGYRRAYIVHGLNAAGTKGIDELSTMGENFVCELKETGEIKKYSFFPQDLGLSQAKESDLSPAENKQKEKDNFLNLISGKLHGPKQDIICLNAAAILYIMKKAKDLKEGIEISRKTIETGKALEKLNQWIDTQN
ncbi:MAG: anthranilate phosphoribosyltransferase [Candidatus Omnitrophota bacterium]|nr:anthranilate phosphoribosyltransferase [Candidatus Omnitrophota bacterium]